MTIKIRVLVCTAIFLLFLSQPAYAYIDPGTGSQMLQVLLAFLIAIPFAIKTSWKKIKMFFTKTGK